MDELKVIYEIRNKRTIVANVLKSKDGFVILQNENFNSDMKIKLKSIIRKEKSNKMEKWIRGMIDQCLIWDLDEGQSDPTIAESKKITDKFEFKLEGFLVMDVSFKTGAVLWETDMGYLVLQYKPIDLNNCLIYTTMGKQNQPAPMIQYATNFLTHVATKYLMQARTNKELYVN